jgi:putative transcriptional regulator
MKPSILIASPQMKDPFFERTVILLYYHDEDGAVGVVVNRPIGHKLGEVLALPYDIDVARYSESQVGWGGPVEGTRGTVVTRGRVSEDEGWPLAEDLAVTRSQEALDRLLHERADLLLCLGHAGWAGGQLESEIERGGWLWTDFHGDLVFDLPLEKRYDRALATLGLNAKTVWRAPIEE